MNVEDIDIDVRFISFLKQQGIEKLYPPQAECIEKGLLEGQNLVVAIPTASGKTLIAMLAIFSKLSKNGGKAVYLAPLRALASEKYEEFSEAAEAMGYKVAIASGDYESGIEWLGSRDIIIATNEKFDSIIRHQASWLNNISVIVSDEVHLINDPHRGPVLEVVLSQVRQKLPNCQILALSATIRNAEDIAEWLDADLVLSEWRPVALKEGVWVGGDVFWMDRTVEEIGSPSEKHGYVPLAIDAVLKGGQCLVFASTRSSVVQTARKIASHYYRYLSAEEKQNLKHLASRILRTGERTQLSLDLANVVEKGVAFHHAGLLNAHRKIIEQAFRQGILKIISASPTLCFAPDTRFQTDRGLLSIETIHLLIEAGQQVKLPALIHGIPKLVAPEAVVKLSNGSPLIQVMTEAGARIVTSQGHRFLVRRKDRQLLIPARQLCQGDLLFHLPFYSIESKPLQNKSTGWFPITHKKIISGCDTVYDVALPESTDHLLIAETLVSHNSAGVNTPSRRVVIRTLSRYSDGYTQMIPVLEYKQMAGRAGRPRYDPYGEAIVIARNLSEKDEIMRRYIEADTEEIYSKFGSEPSLRTHLLSFVVSGDVYDFDSALDIISTTFFGYQNEGQVFFIEELIHSTLELLVEAKLISSKEPYKPTPFGYRVNQLYLDPLTALMLKKGLISAEGKKISEFAYLHLISSTPDIRNFYVREKEMDGMIDIADAVIDDLMVPDRDDVTWDFFLQEIKTAKVLQDWISEKSESEIYEKYNVTSGDLHNLISSAEWLLHSAAEIARLFKLNDHEKQLKTLTLRVKYGISEDLIPLTSLNLIGRKRARLLYINGIKRPADLLKVGKEKVSKLLGNKIAESVLHEVKVGEPLEVEPDVVDFVEEDIEEELMTDQTTLNDFF
ncbi:MAG: DEAD/DEAH box helicase [Methanobacteriota archaeon]|nr:MAG: DEAD/DEAH box helicase [Euryarchaeota archaeon]